MATCVQCKTDFKAKASHQRYCSDKCRVAGYRAGKAGVTRNSEPPPIKPDVTRNSAPDDGMASLRVTPDDAKQFEIFKRIKDSEFTVNQFGQETSLGTRAICRSMASSYELERDKATERAEAAERATTATPVTIQDREQLRRDIQALDNDRKAFEAAMADAKSKAQYDFHDVINDNKGIPLSLMKSLNQFLHPDKYAGDPVRQKKSAALVAQFMPFYEAAKNADTRKRQINAAAKAAEDRRDARAAAKASGKDVPSVAKLFERAAAADGGRYEFKINDDQSLLAVVLDVDGKKRRELYAMPGNKKITQKVGGEMLDSML